MTDQTTFTTSVLKNPQFHVTPLQKTLKSYVNRTTSPDLRNCTSIDEIVTTFNNACKHDIQRIIDECLPTTNSPLTLLTKSDSTSTAFRSLGNDYYKSKNLEQALRCYTLAVQFAPHGSTTQALAYSNRSACHSESNNPKNTLKDITNFESIWTNSTPSITSKIAERKAKCLEKLNSPVPTPITIPFSTEYFTLKSPNPSIPSADKFIGIKQDDTRGRHVVNIGDSVIPPGTPIILEPPFQKILLDNFSFTYDHCTECLKDLNNTGIPCDGCVFASFCTPTCSKSTKTHTPYECLLSPYIHELSPSRTTHLSLSIVLKLTPTDMTNSKVNPSPYPLGFTQTGTYPSTSYTQIHNLIYHTSNHTPTDLISYSATTLTLTILIHSLLPQFPHSPHLTQSTLLLHHLNLPPNAHSLYKLDSPPSPTPSQIKSSTYEEIGAGAFSLLSMINHSCDPNVVRITLPHGTTAVITLHPIPPSAEILDNYGVHFATQPKNSRISHLKSLYNFDCTCPACTDNYPQIDKLMTTQDDQLRKICNTCNGEMTQTQTSLTCDNCNHTTQLSTWTTTHEAALTQNYDSETSLLKNNPVPSFTNSRSALTTFDSTLKRPCKHTCVAQEYMKQSLFLISRDLFR